MALRFIDSFDHYASASIYEKWTGLKSPAAVDPGHWAIVSGRGRRSTSGLLFDASVDAGYAGAALFYSFDLQSTVTVGFAINVLRRPAENTDLVSLCNIESEQVTVQITPSGTLVVLRGDGEELEASSCPLPIGSFHYVELKVALSATVGTAQLIVDGTIQASYSGDTTNGSTTVNCLRMFGHEALVDRGSYIIDDLYLCDGRGSTFNTFLGDVSVYLLSANRVGESQAWTPSTGVSNLAMITDTVPDSDATYNTTTGSLGDLFYSAHPAVNSFDRVLAVVQQLNIRMTSPRVGNITTLLRSGLTEATPNSLSIGGDYGYHTAIYTLNPILVTSWNLTAIASMQFGYGLAASIARSGNLGVLIINSGDTYAIVPHNMNNLEVIAGGVPTWPSNVWASTKTLNNVSFNFTVPCPSGGGFLHWGAVL